MKKDIENKEVIKNTEKPYRFWTKTKKIFAGVIVAVIVAGAAIGLAVGLTGNNKPTPTPPDGPAIEQPANPGEDVEKPGNPGEDIEKPGPEEPGNPGEGEEKPDPEEPGNPGEGDEKPAEKIENVGDLIEKHQSDVLEALNLHYLENAGIDCLGRGFKTEKTSNVEWYINDGKDTNGISDLTLKFNYQAGIGSERYIVCSVKLQNEIKVEDLYSNDKINKDSIANAIKAQAENLECAQNYSFTYNEDNLTTNVDLKNTICDELFGKNETATRYIVDVGYVLDSSGLSHSREFKVVEMTEAGVQEKTVVIKDDDKGFEENFKSGNYRKSGEDKKVEFSGSKLEKTQANLADYVLEMPDGSYFEMC